MLPTMRGQSLKLQFYTTLSNFVQTTPMNSMLFIGGDFNARIEGKFSYHNDSNRNGEYLMGFTHQHNLIVGNTAFQKPKKRLWTWRSPRGTLAQIDFCLYRKRWRKSVRDCQAFNSANPIGSDHRIISTKIRLSVRVPKILPRKKLCWRAVRDDPELADSIDSTISHSFSRLPEVQRTYSEFVRICNKVGKEKLPRKPPREPQPVDCPNVTADRRATLRSATKNLQAAQTQLKQSYDKWEDNRVLNTLRAFESGSTVDHVKAWKLVRELSGKRSGVTFIQGEDRLEAWKNHFSKLLAPDTSQAGVGPDITPVFDANHSINCSPFSQEEVDSALSQMRPGKTPGTDGIPVELWKLPKISEHLTYFCNQTLSGHRPAEWGLSGIVPIPKKGNLTLPDNYRGISLTQVAAKVYSRLLLNRLRPVIDKILRPNQNGFRPSRSTSAQILAFRRIVEEVRNHQKEAVLIFIDFKKAFDSINRDTMLKILLAYGVPPSLVSAIRVMYTNTKATVLTPEGETDTFDINTGVLQGDPLAPFLFIVALDYALRKAVRSNDGITLKRRQSSRHPAVVLPDLDFADDIYLLEDTQSCPRVLVQGRTTLPTSAVPKSIRGP